MGLGMCSVQAGLSVRVTPRALGDSMLLCDAVGRCHGGLASVYDLLNHLEFGF